MKIIISPAKQMRVRDDEMPPQSIPVFKDRAEEILEWLRGLSYEELKKLWGCSEKLATQNYEQLQEMDLDARLTPAVLSYDGIAFKYMAPSVFEGSQFAYVQENLRILSGFYGALRPMDGVVPYRLEMQAKAKIGGTKNLYDYWDSKLYEQVVDESRVVVNLASKEYSKAVEKYLQPEDTFVTCTFAECTGSKLVQKGVYCKMARGEMVRFMASNNVTHIDELKGFDSPDWSYSEEHSTEAEFVFLRQTNEEQ